MISYEIFCKIRHCRDHGGLNESQIAETLALDSRTVKKWLDEKQFHQRKTASRSSKLDPFKPTIMQMLETHPYTAKQVLQRIQEENYTGGYTIVKDYVARIRPKRSPAFLKLSFAPGECAQVDWGSFGSITVGETRRRLSFFVMVMCYSRMIYLEFTVSQTMEHWLACHQNALQFFGGVPKKIMVDNLKSAVIKSVPAEYAGSGLTVKTYADWLCIYDHDKLVARHPRSYDRHRDFEDPDHPKELLAQRKKARDQHILKRFLSITNKAQDYYRKLEKHRLNPLQHVRKIVALSEIYGNDEVSRAIEDTFVFEAFSCEYVANLLEQRARIVKEPGALHLTRKKDLLELNVAEPDLNLYSK